MIDWILEGIMGIIDFFTTERDKKENEEKNSKRN